MAIPNSTFVKHFERVEVTPATGEFAGSFHVAPIWRDVDRPNVGGWVLGPRALADRLARAVESGAAFGAVSVKVDVNGKTYVSAEHLVMGRRANADLRRLGY